MSMAITNKNPGSAAALGRGCTCPVMDNCYGEGIVLGGETCWYMNEDCPLHGRDASALEETDQETPDAG